MDRVLWRLAAVTLLVVCVWAGDAISLQSDAPVTDASWLLVPGPERWRSWGVLGAAAANVHVEVYVTASLVSLD